MKKKKKSTAGTTQCSTPHSNVMETQHPARIAQLTKALTKVVLQRGWGRSVVQCDRKGAPTSRSRAGFQLGHCCRGAQPFLEVVCAYVCCISQCSHTLWVSCDSTLAQQRGYIVLLPQLHCWWRMHLITPCNSNPWQRCPTCLQTLSWKWPEVSPSWRWWLQTAGSNVLCLPQKSSRSHPCSNRYVHVFVEATLAHYTFFRN